MGAVEVIAPCTESVAANLYDTDRPNLERRAILPRKPLGALAEHDVTRSGDAMHGRLVSRELGPERGEQCFADGRAPDCLAGPRNVDVDRVVSEIRRDLLLGHLRIA